MAQAGVVRVLPQLLQGCDNLPPDSVEPCQQGLILRPDGQAVPLGVHGPVPLLGPAASPQVPLEGVVLQQVPVLLRDAGEAGLEVAEQIVVLVIPCHRGQGGGDEGQDGLLEDVAHLGQEHGHAVPGEDGLDELAVPLHAAGGDGDIPEPVALLPHQPENLPGGVLHLGVGAARLEEGDMGGLVRPGGLGGVKEVGLQKGQLLRALLGPALPHLRPGGDAVLTGQPQQAAGRAAGGGEDARAVLLVVQAVAGQGHGHRIGLLEQGLDNQRLLRGKVGEAVQVHVHPLCPAALLQPLRQAGHPVPGVGGPAGGEGLIGPVDEGQVQQLVPLGAVGLLPRCPQMLGRDAAAFQLVHRGDEPGEELRLPGGPAVHLQLPCHRLEGGVHQQQPSARVQSGGSQSAGDREHPACHAGEGEHLGVPGHLIPPDGTQTALHVVGVLLRHHQHLGPDASALSDAPEHGRGLTAPRAAQQQIQHMSLSPLVWACRDDTMTAKPEWYIARFFGCPARGEKNG